MQTEVVLCRSTEVKATHLPRCWRRGFGVSQGRLMEEESLGWSFRRSGTMPTLRGGGRAIRPRHRVCTLHECDILGTSSRRVWLGQNQQDILLVLKISQGVTWNGYFLAVSGEDSSLLLYCSLRTEPGGTLPWPMAIRIFLRESPWTKKSVFFFFSLWKLSCSL